MIYSAMSDAMAKDPIRFCVQFFFGALLGVIPGVYLAVWFAADKGTFWLFPAGTALVVGLVAGFFGDRFWESIREIWNPFRWM